MKSIDFVEEHLEEAYAPMSVTLTLNDDINISRGDTLVKADEKQPASNRISRWMYAGSMSAQLP